MFTNAICYHQNSYSKHYAEIFVQKWESLFQEELKLVDLCSYLTTEDHDISVKSTHTAKINFKGIDYKFVFAFHPKVQFSSEYPSNTMTGLSLIYCNALLAGGCPNPPIYGLWGQYYTHLMALKTLSQAGIAIWKLTDTPNSNDWPIDKDEIFLLDKWLLNRTLQSSNLSFKNLDRENLNKAKFYQIIGNELLILSHAGIQSKTLATNHPFQKIKKYWGTSVLELVAIENDGIDQFLGVHPFFTRFTEPTLKAIKNLGAQHG